MEICKTRRNETHYPGTHEVTAMPQTTRRFFEPNSVARAPGSRLKKPPAQNPLMTEKAALSETAEKRQSTLLSRSRRLLPRLPADSQWSHTPGDRPDRECRHGNAEQAQHDRVERSQERICAESKRHATQSGGEVEAS